MAIQIYEFTTIIEKLYDAFNKSVPSAKAIQTWYEQLQCYSEKQINDASNVLIQGLEKLPMNTNITKLFKDAMTNKNQIQHFDYGYCKSCGSKGYIKILSQYNISKEIYTILCFCKDCRNYQNLTNNPSNAVMFSVKNMSLTEYEEHYNHTVLGMLTGNKVIFETLDGLGIDLKKTIQTCQVVLL